MDTLRGSFDSGEPGDDSQEWDAHESEPVREIPPEAIGQDERRMQVRAYNHWASLLGERTFPSIEDLEPTNLPDFGPNSVLLDFSAGIEDPIVVFLGDKLGEECGMDGAIERLSDVPPRSLLSRITDHYLQILANQAPIGFEAEFVNQRGLSILYRGILLPYSSDDETIDFIYGVINWKEMADQLTSDELLLEIDQAIEDSEEPVEEDEPHKHHADPVTDWADSPAHDMTAESGEEIAEEYSEAVENVESIEPPIGYEAADDDLPLPDFGQYHLDEPEDEDEEGEDDDGPGYSFASLTDYIEAPAKKAIEFGDDDYDDSEYEVDYGDGGFGEDAAVEPEPVFEAEPEPFYEPETANAPEPVAADHGEADQDFVPHAEEVADLADIGEVVAAHDDGLHDCLQSARELAETARNSEDRSRQALYAAVGRAYDFSLAAQDDPQEYGELLEENGLTAQDRAPMTPVVKLVFGADYDKTRLTEYAAVLSHAHRVGIERGSLAAFLGDAEGGLKGVVSAERRLRREEAGKDVEPEKAVRLALAEKLRALEALTLEALAKDGPEFGLVMIRRNAEGAVEVIGELEEDVPMIERAARKLVG